MQGQPSRVARSKKQAEKFYDSISRWYHLEYFFEKGASQAGIEMLHPQQGERVLEIGFGTGESVVEIARLVGETGSVCGVDISAGMLRAARSRVAKNGLSPRVKLARRDASSLPYGSQFFDAVFMSFTLELFDTPEIPVVLNECRRVLLQDGRICVVALAKTSSPAVSIYEWLHRAFPKFVDCRPIFLTRVLEDARFGVIQSRSLGMWGLPVEIALAKKSFQYK
jgi:ubiquinone/menaquinone biosynthesis C-methylase UbiE